jgi:GntR family histidine utilization transcriptional repressor
MIPSYVKIKKFIVESIQSGSLKSGDKVFSENELAKKFQVSRMTANRAINELVADGFLVRIQGKGTYVAGESRVSEILEIKNIKEEISQLGKKYSVRVYSIDDIKADSNISKIMGVKLGENIYHGIFVHLADGVPFQLEERYVNKKLAPDFIKCDFFSETPHEYLMKTIPLSEAEHIVQAVLPDENVSQLLGISSNTPCLCLTRRTWFDDTVVTYAKFVSPGDRYKIGTKFKFNQHGSIVRKSVNLEAK